jgi:hypothetical protein
MPASGVVSSTGQGQTSTNQTVSSQSTGSTNQVSPALLTALVELLKKKIA